MRLLEKDPAARPASGIEVASALSTLLGGGWRPLEGVLAEGRAEQLRRLAFFSDFREAELWELLRWTRWEEVPPGAVLLREGEEGDSFFIVVEGRVAVTKAGRDLARLGAGQCIGEISCLGGRPRPATVTALERVCVVRVDAALLDDASSECRVALQRALITTLVERLADTAAALAGGG
jgi:CRP-like cAMP-binding protein